MQVALGRQKKTDSGSEKPIEESEAVANIEPVSTPEKWDKEADVVVVGCGAAGLNACARASEVVVRKQSSSKRATTLEDRRNIRRLQPHMGRNANTKAVVSTFTDKATWDTMFDTLWSQQDYTVEERVEKALIKKSGEMIDWMGDSLGIEWQDRHTTEERLHAFRYHMKKQPPEFRHVGIMGYVTDALVEKVQEMGTELMRKTEVTALVKDEDRIVGVQVRQNDETMYIKGKSVVLCAGGMANNLDMLAKYVPTALERCGSTWDMYGTGEVIRMGWGAGADIAGREFFDCFDGGIPYYERGTGPWYRFLYSGDTALARNPWLFVNDYAEQFCMLFPGDQSFWRPRIIQSQPNHHAYVIFDDRFP